MGYVGLMEKEFIELADFEEEETSEEKEETKKEKEVDEYVSFLLAEQNAIIEQEHFAKNCLLAILDSHLEVVTPPPEDKKV